MTPTIPDLVRECLADLRAQRPADAAVAARQILAAEPDSFDGLHLLGVCEASLGAFDAACGLLRRALALRPDRMDVRATLVQALEHGRRYGEVAQELRIAGTHGADGAALVVRTAIARMRRKEHAAALDILDDLLGRRPDHVEAAGKRAECLAAIDRIADAEQAWRRLLARDPSNLKALDTLASILMRGDRPAEAVELLRRAIALAETAPRCN